MKFKAFFEQFENEVDVLFFEMPVNIPKRLPIFDEDDQKYYKHILDAFREQAPESIRNDRKAMVSLLRQALEIRYGKKIEGDGSGSAKKGGNGKLLRTLEQENESGDQDHLNHTFNIGGKKFTIEEIPMFPRKVIEKAAERGIDFNDTFGHGFGILNSSEKVAGSGNQKAAEYLNFFLNGTPVSDKSAYYSPMRGKFIDASDEDKQKVADYHRAGVHKKVNTDPDYDSDAERGRDPIPFDDEDKKFLEDFKAKVNEHFGGDAGPLFASRAEKMAESLARNAIALRYSNHFIVQNADGEFEPRPEYRSKQEPNGLMRVDINIPYVKHIVHIKDVYMNLPQLVEKFDKFKASRNFVKKPMLNQDMADADKRREGLQAAERFIKNGKMDPRHGERGEENVRDMDFYNQMKEDQDLWKSNGGQPVEGEPVSKKSLLRKLTWRQGNTIIESPNIKDVKLGYDSDNMDFDDLIKHDAKTSVHRAIRILKGTRYSNVPGFEDFAKRPEVFDDAVGAAWTALTTTKTGVDPARYRSQRSRLNMASNVASNSLMNQFKLQGRGGEDDDKGPDMVTGTADQNDTGLNFNTGARHHGDEPDSQQQITHSGIEGDDIDMWSKDDDNHPEEPMWTASPAATQVARKTLAMPPGMSLRIWAKMNQAQKLAAMQAAGMIKPGDQI